MIDPNSSLVDKQLSRLRLLLQRRVLWLRHLWGKGRWDDPEMSSVSDRLADLLLAQPGGGEAESRFIVEDPEAAAIAKRLGELERELASQRYPPMSRMADRFHLTEFDQDVLWLCLATDLDSSFEPLFAYVQDDIQRRHPTPQLALALFGAEVDRVCLRKRFSTDSPLRRSRLISLQPGLTSAVPAALRPIRIEDRVAEFLQGGGGLDERLTERVWRLSIQGGFPESQRNRVERLRQQVQEERVFCINLAGPPDSGKLAAARELSALLGLTLFRIDPLLLPTAAVDREEMLRLIERDARLFDYAFLVRVPESAEKRDEAILTDLVERFPAPLIVLSEHPWRGGRAMTLETMAKPGRAEQLHLWRRELGEIAVPLNGDLEAIIQQFDLGPETIAKAAADALRGTTPVTGERLWEACRRQTGLLLDDLATRIEPSYQWSDIVLPEDAFRQLQEIASQVASRPLVYERWGFGAKLARGRGITALFSGPSGTGKTMAAEILGQHLGLDLYRIDLAGVVSKYIGETEKNLRRIFDAAERSGAILFFDEADALFGKRTDIKDSHDRYANIEINYLLQRMESYSGLAILATNRKSALDRAFLRRLRFLVDFPFPDSASRKRIWQKVFPDKAPLGDIDWDFLAQLEIPGGNIRNIALNAAFLAAGKEGRIGPGELMHAVRREYAKIDKLVTESEFGHYYKM